MSEQALEQARVRTRRRHPKPPGRRPEHPWWFHALWTGAIALGYVAAAQHRLRWLAVPQGLLIVGAVWLAHLEWRWWRWERQEGLPHVQLARWMLVEGVVGAMVYGAASLLWLVGAIPARWF